MVHVLRAVTLPFTEAAILHYLVCPHVTMGADSPEYPVASRNSIIVPAPYLVSTYGPTKVQTRESTV